MKVMCALKKIVPTILILLSFALAGCNSSSTQDPSTPREVLCLLKYTGATYAPFHRNAPYRYTLYDINGKFVAYLDSSKLVIPRMDTYLGRYVVVRGPIVKLDGETVMRAEAIYIKH